MKYGVDYHTHTQCSIDSEESLANMVQAAVKAGLSELCTTDHYDLLTQDGHPERQLDWTKIVTQYQSVVDTCPKDFKLRLGIELGSAHFNPTLAETVTNDAPLDFVIGSVHNSSIRMDYKDYYFMDYTDVENCHRILDDYLDQMQALAEAPNYDILGHVIYPLRYMPPMGEGYLAPQYRDRFVHMLETVVKSGRGIELNTNRGRDLPRWKPVLELYRACGGELITTGTDAHDAQHVALGIADAQELLRETGFRYQTIYEGRKPQFITL